MTGMRKRQLKIDDKGTIFRITLDTIHHPNKLIMKTLSVYYDVRQDCIVVYSVGNPVIKIPVNDSIAINFDEDE